MKAAAGGTETSVAPHFSVILPTYNRAGRVIHAVESVLSQTCPDFELIVVDDGSTDDTTSVLADSADPRLTVVPNERTKGVAGARNTGIFRARGEWICQIDSDDTWPPDMLERLADAIASSPPGTGIVYGSLGFIDEASGCTIRVRRAEKAGNVHLDFLEDHFIHQCSAALLARGLREIGGYDEDFAAKEDSDLLLRLTERYTVVPVPDLVYNYCVGGDDKLSSHNRVFLESYQQYIAKHSAILEQHPGIRCRLLSNVLTIALHTSAWRTAVRTWCVMSPSLWRAPHAYVRAQMRLTAVLVEMAKGRIRRFMGAPRLAQSMRRHRPLA